MPLERPAARVRSLAAELRGLLDGEIAGLGALEDSINVHRATSRDVCHGPVPSRLFEEGKSYS
jgi:hypothetical protein